MKPSTPKVDFAPATYAAPEFTPRPARTDTPGWPRRILLALDGTGASEAAVRVVRDLASIAGSAVDAMAVYAPRIPIPHDVTGRGADRCAHGDRRGAARLLTAVRRQIASIPRAERSGWSLGLDVGDPGATLVRLAAERNADVVVVGIGQLEPLDEPAAGHTAVCAARHLRVPLLAVADGVAPASRCVMAFPTGRISEKVMRAANVVMAPAARVWIALPERDATAHPERFDAACAALFAARGVETSDVVERVAVSGDLSTGVLQLAERVGATLIVVPIHGRPGAVRAFLPNVAEELLVQARCSVIVVPDS